jgi:uncharacterized membrane protein HdeD (DUF308 family)
VVYGIPDKNWVVVIVNAVGIVMEGVYCVLYISYSTGKRRVVAIILFIAEFIAAGILVTLLLTVFRHGHNADAREVVFGVLGSITGALMYVSPVMDMVSANRLLASFS